MPRSVTAVTTRRGRTPTGTHSPSVLTTVSRVEAFPCDPAVVGVDVAADHPRRLESRRPFRVNLVYFHQGCLHLAIVLHRSPGLVAIALVSVKSLR